MQGEGLRVLSFRHEQSAGYAAAIAGFLTQKPGVCLTVSAPGFLNGLTALAHATTNCYPRSEEHTSELQSLMRNLVCRLLLEKKKEKKKHKITPLLIA